MSLEPILFVPDCHIPYHDKRAWQLTLHVARALRPRHILVLGDFADFYAVSSHSKDPARTSRRRLRAEMEAARACRSDLDGLGATNKVFVAGNHEDRLTRYLMDKAPELYDLDGVQIPELLGLKGWTYVPYKEDYRLGKLWATHDVGYAGRYGAQRLLDTYQHCIVGGHTHRLSYIVEGNAAGEAHVAATFGWLGSAKRADYMHRVKAAKDWALGFGIGFLETKTGVVHITPVPIVMYRCVVLGREFRA